MWQALTGLVTALKDMSPLPLAIAGVIFLGWGNLTVIQGNTAAITRLVVLHEKLSIQEDQIMRRLDFMERDIRRK